MSDEQKIWFVYLTDHHEGPFTPSEVAGMVITGVVTPQSLGWKDGLAEWVAIDSIPELKTALDASIIAAATGAAPPSEADFSLAQMLAGQQQAEAPAAAELTSGADALAAFTGQANSSGAAVVSGGASPDEPVWSLNIGARVSGLFSLADLKKMAGAGEIPAEATLWRRGWTDFQSVATVAEVAAARKTKSMVSSSTGFNRRPAGLVAATPGADPGDDEATDTGIRRPNSLANLKNVGQKFLARLQKKKPVAAVPAAALPLGSKTGSLKMGLSGKKVSVPVHGGLKARVKRVAGLIAGLAVLAGGAGAAYYFLLASPFPADLDVTPDDLEVMTETVKAPPAAGGKLFLALARGTEAAPLDDTAPKYYVATNLPEHSDVQLHLLGKPGTLVNRASFEKDFHAFVQKDKLAVFERLQDEGKPLPMGEYTLSLTAPGAAPLKQDRFLGGRKGPVYQDRLRKYKEKLSGDYDKEMQELKEIVDTLKTLEESAAEQISDFKAVGKVPANRTRLQADWKAYAANLAGLGPQLDAKIKAHTASGATTYQPRIFQDIGSTLQQLQQLVELHSQQLAGTAVTGNQDETEGMVQASVASLEQLIAQAKPPGEAAAPAPAPTPAPAPAKSAAPAASPAH